MKKVFFFTVLSLMAGVVLTPSLSAQGTPREYAENFFSVYETEGIEAAIDTLYSTNKWMTKNKEAVSNLKSQMKEELKSESIGKHFGQDLFINKKLTGNYQLLRYIVKFERQPILFTFQFYRPDNEWKIYSFRYSFRVAQEFEEASMLELLKIEEK